MISLERDALPDWSAPLPGSLLRFRLSYWSYRARFWSRGVLDDLVRVDMNSGLLLDPLLLLRNLLLQPLRKTGLYPLRQGRRWGWNDAGLWNLRRLGWHRLLGVARDRN